MILNPNLWPWSITGLFIMFMSLGAPSSGGASTDPPRILALITGLAIVGFASSSIAVGWRRTAATTARSLDHSEAS